MTLIASTLQAFFTERLTQQRQASPRTIASYRDTLKLLLQFVHTRAGKAPSQLDWDDLDADTITAFLTHLEAERHNSVRTRNLRLTAIRSLFSYASLRHPEHALLIQRVLAIPPKRFDKRIVEFLNEAEVEALLAAPDPRRWEGRRDRVMFHLAIQTGLRVSELTGLTCGDITLGDNPSVRCVGKGRKQRVVPLDAATRTSLQTWLAERGSSTSEPLFPTRTGRRLSRDAVALRLAKHAQTAAARCPTLAGRRLHPHVLRHSCDGFAASRGRHHRHRVVARPCWHPVHRRLRARRHHAQGTSARPHYTGDRQAWPLSPARQGPGVPGKPVTMPRPTAREPRN